MPKPRTLRDGTLLKGPRETTPQDRGEFPFQYLPHDKMWHSNEIYNLRIRRAKQYLDNLKNVNLRDWNSLNVRRKAWSYKRELLRLKRELSYSQPTQSTIWRVNRFVSVFNKWTPVRYENLEKVLPEILMPDPFEGKEVLYGMYSGPEPMWYSPEQKAVMGISSAKSHVCLHDIHDVKYTAKIFFDESVFRPNKEMTAYKKEQSWGFILGSHKAKVLAVQILDPDPLVVFKFTKDMLKRMPDDPIIVIDLYGRIFFP